MQSCVVLVGESLKIAFLDILTGNFVHLVTAPALRLVSEILLNHISETEDMTMSKRDRYSPDYHRLYPGVMITPPVMRVLRQSDRKMKYCEFDLKTDRKRENKRTRAVTVVPAREDSLERLAEDNNRQYALEETPVEETLAKKDEMDRLHRAMLQLEPTELALVRALFFEGNSERQYAERLGLSQKAVNKRWHKVRLKLKNFMEF